MYCKKCGTKIPDGYEFCMNCGTKNSLEEKESLSIKNEKKEEQKAIPQQAKRKQEQEALNTSTNNSAESLFPEMNSDLKEKKKKRKKKFAIIICCVILALITVIIASIVSIPMIKKARTYAYANELFNQDKYEEAFKVFNSLGEYKDSEAMALESQYQNAISLYDNEKYENAKKEFEKCTGYNDTDDYLLKCQYKILSRYLDDDSFDLTTENIKKCQTEYDELMGNGVEDVDNLKFKIFYQDFTYKCSINDNYKSAVKAFNDYKKENPNDKDFTKFTEGVQTSFYTKAELICFEDVHDSHDYVTAKRLFSVCDENYKDVAVYLYILDILSNPYGYDEDSFEKDKEFFLDNLDNPITDDLLFSYYVDDAWLMGRWETWDGKYYFKFNSNGSTQYNFMDRGNGDRYIMFGGKYYCYSGYASDLHSFFDNKKPSFEFIVQDYNTMVVYCRAADEYYTLYKK